MTDTSWIKKGARARMTRGVGYSLAKNDEVVVTAVDGGQVWVWPDPRLLGHEVPLLVPMDALEKR